MTDLTEQWKNGQLKSFRWYYVKFKTGEIDSCWLTEWSNDEVGTGGQYFEGIKEENIVEVIALAPSYDEWKVKLEENTMLKELLKECRDEIEYLRKHYKGNIDHFKNNTRLDKKISQALGEHK